MLPTPAGVLVRLLRIVSSRDEANAAVGDILEELVERNAAGLGPRSPRLWVNWQAVRSIGSTMLAGVPRMLRSAGLILRDAARALRAAPANSLFVVFVLAIGVTAGTVTFSVVDAVVLKPLPVEQPERLVFIPTRDQDYKERITPEVFWRLHDHLDSVEVLAPRMTFSGTNVTVGSISDEWPMMYTSADIFRALRWAPAIGRFWTADDEAKGKTDVAVLGYRFWREKFQGDASVIGETVTSGKRTYRVIGVLPAASDHPELDLTSTPIWVPRVVPRTGPSGPFSILARMRPGVSVAQVAADVKRLSEAPDWHPDIKLLHDTYVAPVSRWMLLALGAAALVMLIACVNAANLMLTRSARRAQEMAIRASLGASRRQIAASVLAEGLLLSLAATACALLCSFAGVRIAKVAVTTMLAGVFRASTISLNLRVLAASAAAAVVTGLLVSLVPAWQTSRAPLSSLLKDADGPTATGRRRWRSVFLTAEVAAVSVLMVVSWLFVVSLIRVVGIDLGIDRTNLLAISPRGEFQGPVDEVQRRIQGVAGVSGVAVSTVTSLPLVGRAYSGAWIDTTVQRADGDPGTGERPLVKVLQYRVTPNYFDVAGLSFQRGGTWSAEAVVNSPAVVLDERAARQLFGDENPLGQQVRAAEPAGIFTVAGTVPYVYAGGPEEHAEPAAYFPLKPSPTRMFASLFVKTSRPAAEMVPLLTEALKPFAPKRKGQLVFVADEAVGKITATRRFNAGLMSAFGLVGLLIGMAGVYAVMASFVAQQTREIGVRMALGATPSRIQRGVMSVAWRHLVVGLAIGLPAAWWLSRGFATLLFQVTPADASVYVGVAALLCLVGFMAAWLPARRASRIDPIISLRN